MWIVGIDLGTSSTKFLCLSPDNRQVTVRLPQLHSSSGEHTDPSLWRRALSDGFSELSRFISLKEVSAVCLTGQTNTYIFFSSSLSEHELPVISWTLSEPELESFSSIDKHPDSYYLDHISMPHPRLVSYPLPRFLWVRTNRPRIWERTQAIMQPKDYVYYGLTGEFFSDPFTWRGLANIGDASFHDEVLSDFGIPASWLPKLFLPWEAAARIRNSVADDYGLPRGTPVYLGCSDFFSSTLGVGAVRADSNFNITGTSEHIGQVVRQMPVSTPLVTSPHFYDSVHYGATANSGRSIEWIRRLAGGATGVAGVSDASLAKARAATGPLFLPYLRGERAPIFSPFARGVFFGLDDSHTIEDLSHAVLEGVAFSIFHIWQLLGATNTIPILCGGGAAGIGALNTLKANVFGVPFRIAKQKEAAALGAAIIGSVGEGWHSNLDDAARAYVKVDQHIEPDASWRNLLMERFTVYRNLSDTLKQSYMDFSSIRDREYD